MDRELCSSYRGCTPAPGRALAQAGREWSAGQLAGDIEAKASYNASQGQSQEVSEQRELSASLLLPHPPIFLNDN